jgi:hypothetical protein
MTEFNSSKNSSQSGNNVFGLMFIIALAIHAAVLMMPIDYHSKTSDSAKKEDKKSKVEPSVSTSPKLTSAKSPESLAKEDTKKSKVEGDTKKTEVATDTKTTEAKSAVPSSAEGDSGEIPEDNSKSNETESDDKQTPANKTTGDATTSDNSIVKDLRDRIRTKLLASENSDSVVVDKFINSLPVAEVAQENASYFFEGEALKPGIRGSVGIAETDVKIAYEQYIEPILNKQLGFELEEISDGYGGEKLYKAHNAEGVELYLSLVGVGTPSPTQTFVVIWEKDPRRTSRLD